MAREDAARDPATVMREIFTAAAPGATYYGVALPAQYATALGTALTAADEPPTVRVIASRSALRELRQDFLAASKAANYVEADRLAIRKQTTADGEPAGPAGTPMIVGEGSVHALLLLADGRGDRLSGRKGSFSTAAFERCERAWTDAETYPLLTPGRARVGETMEAEWGPEFRSDFEASLTQASAMRNPAEFEEVTAALLVAAKHGALQYNVSKWGEDVGLASKATFSRRKTRLEEMGVLETDPVETGLGRPRERLSITDEYVSVLEGTSIAKLISRITA